MVARCDLARMLLISDAELEYSQGQVFGRWRFVLEDLDRKTRFEATDWEPDIELDRLQLLTVIRGLEELDQPSHVTVVTTGKSFVHGVQFGLAQWRDNDWMWERFGEMVPITDGDLWRRFERANRIHRIQCQAATATATAALLPVQPAWTPADHGGVAPHGTDAPWGIRERASRWARRLARVAASIAPV